MCTDSVEAHRGKEKKNTTDIEGKEDKRQPEVLKLMMKEKRTKGSQRSCEEVFKVFPKMHRGHRRPLYEPLRLLDSTR